MKEITQMLENTTYYIKHITTSSYLQAMKN